MEHIYYACQTLPKRHTYIVTPYCCYMLVYLPIYLRAAGYFAIYTIYACIIAPPPLFTTPYTPLRHVAIARLLHAIATSRQPLVACLHYLPHAPYYCCLIYCCFTPYLLSRYAVIIFIIATIRPRHINTRFVCCYHGFISLPLALCHISHYGHAYCYYYCYTFTVSHYWLPRCRRRHHAVNAHIINVWLYTAFCLFIIIIYEPVIKSIGPVAAQRRFMPRAWRGWLAITVSLTSHTLLHGIRFTVTIVVVTYHLLLAVRLSLATWNNAGRCKALPSHTPPLGRHYVSGEETSPRFHTLPALTHDIRRHWAAILVTCHRLSLGAPGCHYLGRSYLLSMVARAHGNMLIMVFIVGFTSRQLPRHRLLLSAHMPQQSRHRHTIHEHMVGAPSIHCWLPFAANIINGCAINNYCRFIIIVSPLQVGIWGYYHCHCCYHQGHQAWLRHCHCHARHRRASFSRHMHHAITLVCLMAINGHAIISRLPQPSARTSHIVAACSSSHRCFPFHITAAASLFIKGLLPRDGDASRHHWLLKFIIACIVVSTHAMPSRWRFISSTSWQHYAAPLPYIHGFMPLYMVVIILVAY